LGPVGALAYRVVQLIARDGRFGGLLDSVEHARFVRVATALDWAPAHLMALTLALVSDFDAVLATWRNYHAAHGRGYFTLDLGFLGALARVGVDADVLAGDGYAADVSDPMIELADARTVLRRVLLTWLALIALLVLASWVR
ncbi:MAG: beta-lactamase induction protein, partial [Rhodanobacteraceae bacterium]